MLRLELALVVAASVLVGSAQAGAMPLAPDEVYTLDSSVAWSLDGGTHAGTLDPFLVSEGNLNFVSNAVCLDGACTDPNDFSAQDWLVFRVNVTNGSLQNVGLSNFSSAIGLGYFDDLGGTFPLTGDSTTVPTLPEFGFSPNLTGQSALLFVAYADGLPSSGPLGSGGTQFMMETGGTSATFVGTVTTVVPEPATFALLAAGLIGLGFSGRRPRR